MTATATHRAISAVWRIESARLIAGLARLVRDVGLAEELAPDALVAALERWPESGVPDKPGAWLMATAKHRAVDRLRRDKRLERKHEELGHELEARQERTALEMEAAVDDDVGDDLLRLVLTACHPVLPTEARVALTLRLLGGLTTEEIAFNEGYSATAGEDWVRPELCQDALRLGRILTGLVPKEPEVHGLVAAETDWVRIAALYEALAQLTPSPVVELNRAVAVAMAFGPAAGLELVDALTSERALEGYHLLPSVRGDLLMKLGRLDEAREELEHAASLTQNERERELLLDRAATCKRQGSVDP